MKAYVVMLRFPVIYLCILLASFKKSPDCMTVFCNAQNCFDCTSASLANALLVPFFTFHSEGQIIVPSEAVTPFYATKLTPVYYLLKICAVTFL